MLPRILPALAVLALLAPAAHAQGTTVVSDPDARSVTALNGVLVWVTGATGSQKLMQRRADGIVMPVTGAPTAAAYTHVDLGLDASGSLVLTYRRCRTSVTRCTALRDDLAGRRSSFRGLTRPGCALTTAPAQWRARLVYGVSCREDSRTGLYFKNGSKAPRRLATPREARRAGANLITHVEIRNSAIAAIAADIASIAWYTTAASSVQRAWTVALNEGETAQQALGLAIGARNVTFTLAISEHLDDPHETLLSRLTEQCLETQTMRRPQPDFPAIDVAADGRSLYLLVPQNGIVTHSFAANFPC